MKPERWQQIKSLLQAVLDREPAERRAFLDEACKDDKLLRQQVNSFIISHEQAGGFLEDPAFEVMAESLENNQAEVVGHTLNHYKILEQLGVGGMGVVYLALDARLGRKVALKMLPAYFTKDDERVRRFQLEARAASALNHPNILTIYEIGQTDSRHFIATEHIEGVTLREQMTRAKITISEALDVAIQVSSALTAAHQAGIIHRDIKPDNIMIRTDGYVKVLDFGLAKLTEPKTGESEATTLVHTKQGMVMGTAHYMSPEQARGLNVDARTDIFSLGVVLYEMVAGRMPFEGETVTDVLASILMVEPPPLNQSAPDAPAELQHIVDRSLRKDKAERYQTIKDMLVDLRALKQELEFETKRGQYRSQTKVGRRSKAINSLAVLPLFNVSSDPNTEYLSDGITESIINSLSQLPKLRVMARSTVFRYKDREIDPQEVGRDLKVRAVLMGRVQQLDERLIIGAELVDVTDGSQLWGDHYNRELSDIFAVQEEIAKEITEKLQLKLSGDQRKQLTKRYTDNTEAYQLYLQGRFYWNRRTSEGIGRGIQYFHEAIEEDPNYALAFAGLADCYIMAGFYDYLPPADAFPKAKMAALKALEIDDALAEAHISLAAIRTFYEWDWLDAERDFKQGIKLNSNSVKAHHWYACSLTSQGRFEEGIKEMKCAQEIEPLSLIINRDVGRHYYFLRQYDQAIAQCRQTLEMDPSFFLAHFYLVPAYEQKGMFEEAIKELQKAIALSGSSVAMIALLGHVYAVSGRRDKALGALEELKERAKSEYVSAFFFVLIHLGLDEKDQAFEWLERAYQERSTHLVWLKVDPIFDGLRSDVRFTELVRRIGLAPSKDEPTSGGAVTPELTDTNSRSIPLEQEIRFCTTADGVSIAYATVGEGPPLVKAANWLNHLEFDWKSPIWRHLFEEFARDHFLVRYDERGNGLSDWNVENLSFESLVQDLEAVVDAVGLDRFPILGISQGGPVAIAYAIRHPEKVSHLILYGCYARGWDRRGSPPEEIERRHAYLTLVKLGWGQDNPAFRQLWTTLFMPDATQVQWQSFNDLQRITTSPENAFRLLTEFGKLDVVDLLPQVKVPTLVLHCRNEAVAPFEEGRLIAGMIPGARFVPLEGRNHLLLESEPAWPKFVAEVRRFLGVEQKHSS